MTAVKRAEGICRNMDLRLSIKGSSVITASDEVISKNAIFHKWKQIILGCHWQQKRQPQRSVRKELSNYVPKYMTFWESSRAPNFTAFRGTFFKLWSQIREANSPSPQPAWSDKYLYRLQESFQVVLLWKRVLQCKKKKKKELYMRTTNPKKKLLLQSWCWSGRFFSKWSWKGSFWRVIVRRMLKHLFELENGRGDRGFF